jgi:uncharacterized membrane protein YqgA involved in biofilm formation
MLSTILISIVVGSVVGAICGIAEAIFRIVKEKIAKGKQLGFS